jgi:CelD/BcsL family acetyltransferase involved in cellulose biosynthesis
MHVSLCNPHELSEADLAAWRALCALPEHDSPFLTPEFALAVGRVREDARVLVLRANGAVKLVLPVQVSGAGLARPLGAPMCDVNGPIAAEGDAGLLARALGRAGLAAYVFNGWTGARNVRGLKLRGREGSAVADLRGGFDAWLEAQRGLYPKHFKKMRRLARQGEKDFGAESVTFGPASAEDLATLVGWKREQFARTRRHDVLGAAWTRGLLEDCARHQGTSFAGVMATLRYDGKLAAAEFGLRSGGTLHGWIAGYDPQFASCSPGLVLQERLLEHAAQAGVTRAVLGTGEGHYKKYYASFHEPSDEGVVMALGAAGGARAAAAGVLHAVERGRFGAASRFAARTRRRLDVILAVETSVGGKLAGISRALGEDPTLTGASRAIDAAFRAAPL